MQPALIECMCSSLFKDQNEGECLMVNSSFLCDTIHNNTFHKITSILGFLNIISKYHCLNFPINSLCNFFSLSEIQLFSHLIES